MLVRKCLSFLVVTIPIGIGIPLQADSHARRLFVSELLEVPPAIQASLGDPRINFVTETKMPAASGRVITGKSPVGTRSNSDDRKKRRPPQSSGSPRKATSVVFLVNPETGELEEALRSLLVDFVLEEVWETEFASRRPGWEAIRLDRDRFFRIGRAFLVGETAKLAEIERAWWRVRMGLPQERDPVHHLLVLVATNAEGVSAYGHFALGLRHQEGRPSSDFVIDPRAPWSKREPPSFRDFGPGSASMQAGLHPRNLYDWLYTQTHYRGQEISARVFEVSRDQVMLLRSYEDRTDLEQLAPFRGFRFNCATLGEQVLSSLLPLNEPLCRPHPIADLPTRLARKTENGFSLVRKIRMEARQRRSPEERTSNWTIHRAPIRRQTPEFFQLQRCLAASKAAD